MEKLLHFLVGTLFLLSGFQESVAETVIESDKQALLDFSDKLHPSRRTLNWDSQSSVCKDWMGVACNEDGTRVISLRLPGLGLHGPIPTNTLSRLSALQILSLRANEINGSFPLDFGNLKNLTFLYLQHNNFWGPLPLDFSVWRNLTILNLSNNEFNGSIPLSISGLSRLVALNLANNSFSGEVPSLDMPNLQLLNFSYNELIGSVPKSLQRFPKSVFAGNSDSLLNYNVSDSLIVLAPREHDSRGKSHVGKLSEKALIGIVIAGSVMGVLGFGFMLIICILRRKSVGGFPGKLEIGNMSPEKAISRGQDASNKLVFFEECNYTFDLEDLLRASAEVLGKGTFGTAYKVILEDATMVVVKRLKDLNVGKKEFEQQMTIIGSIKHENVIQLRAYYYSKEEKLIIYDYYNQGSLASMLHGKQGHTKTFLDWETRLKIAISAAKGLVRIHAENNGKLVHGNLKSSNVFLNSAQFGCISDLGLSTIMSALAPPVVRAAGYLSPEVTDTRKAMQPSDVYSFGVILLELLTGKSSVHTSNGDEVIHLVRWVQSVVREEWTAEVFDVELLRHPNIDEELVEMLQIAMACVSRIAEQRPKMSGVVKMLEGIRHFDHTNGVPYEGDPGNRAPESSSSGV